MRPPTPRPLAQPPELPGTQPAASPGVQLTSQFIPCLFSHSPGHPPRPFMQDRIPTPTLGLGPGPSVPTKAWEVVSAAQATPGLPGKQPGPACCRDMTEGASPGPTGWAQNC